MRDRWRDMSFWLLAIALCATALQAERYGGEFLNIPAGAKAYGLGGAFGPVADDASAIYWNPAGIARIARPQVMVAHTELFGGLATHDFMGVTCPIARGVTVGAAWIRLGVDDIPRFSHTVGTPPQGSFGDNENAVLISAASLRNIRAWRVPLAVSFGGSAKLIYDRLDDKQATGLGLDLGLLLSSPVRYGGDLRVSLNSQDIGGTGISWNTVRQTRDIRYTVFKAGTAYVQPIARLHLTAMVCYETSSEILQRNRAGAELCFRPRPAIAASLRAGHDGQGATVGAGIECWRITLDYGFSKHELGNSHRVGASFRL
jgi:hypothetical protein